MRLTSVDGGGGWGRRQTALTSFNFRHKKCFNIDSMFNTVERCRGGGGMGGANGFNIAFQQNRTDVEANVEAVCPGKEDDDYGDGNTTKE